MKSNITIKSIQNGIKVFLDPDCDFNEVLNETANKFRDSKGFFKGGKLAVSFVGRRLSEEEEKELVEVLEENGEFTVLYVITTDENGEENIAKSLNKVLAAQEIKGFGTTYKGSVYKGEHLSFECGVLILGDIEPGALVRAKGNVIVLGGLYGSVNIDFDEDEEPGFIYAQEMSPERIRIGEKRYYNEKAKWSIRPKNQAKIAYIHEGAIKLEPADKKAMKEI